MVLKLNMNIKDHLVMSESQLILKHFLVDWFYYFYFCVCVCVCVFLFVVCCFFGVFFFFFLFFWGGGGYSNLLFKITYTNSLYVEYQSR